MIMNLVYIHVTYFKICDRFQCFTDTDTTREHTLKQKTITVFKKYDIVLVTNSLRKM